jgi:exodeoxyribonuclease VII small subunit
MKFEEGLGRLEEIVATLEGGKVPLDEALNLFKEGLSLTRELSRRLDETEKKVEILLKKDDGTIERKPFAGDREE